MSSPGKQTLLLCQGLETEEQSKVERLDNRIAEHFGQAGLAVRLCQGNGIGELRRLDFFGDLNGFEKIGTTHSSSFLGNSDQEAVRNIEIAIR